MDFEIIHIKQLDSTNNFALQLIENNIVNEGVAIWTDEQKSGIGYGKNKWESEKAKNLLCSLILKPVFILPANQFVLTQVVSLSLIKLLKMIIPDVDLKIKWPNDIYADDKKIAGILIQNIIRGQRIDYSIIGIGLNVNQEVFYSDAPNPVSMIHFSNDKLSVESILKQLLTEIDAIYSKSASSQFLEDLSKTYMENLYRHEQWANYRAGAEQFRAKIIGIGQYGRLILQMETNETRHFDFKEVELQTG